MDNLFKTQIKNGRKVLSYHYKKIQDIDDVILQLLNEAGVEGFIRSEIDRQADEVDYDITGYVPLANYKATGMSADNLKKIFDDLYQILVYLEDSFIDGEYVVFDIEHMFINPDTGKLYLIVLPCDEAVSSEITLSDCLENIICSYTYTREADQSGADRMLAAVRQGIRSLTDLKKIIDMQVTDMPVDDSGTEIKYEDPEESVPMEINEKSETINVEQVREELRQEVMEQVREELRQEVMKQVREEIYQDAMEQAREEIRQEVTGQVEEELSEDATEQLLEEIQQEMMIEADDELAPAIGKQTHPYLLRKNTGEFIQLDGNTFIIGKMGSCCDYVIRNNSSVSRLHAIIKYRETEDEYFIVDCNSTNHIYLNGRQIPSEQPETLSDGMHIHLANEEFIFRIHG